VAGNQGQQHLSDSNVLVMIFATDHEIGDKIMSGVTAIGVAPAVMHYLGRRCTRSELTAAPRVRVAT